MRDIGIRLVVDDSQKTKFAGISSAVAKAQEDLDSRLNSSLARAAASVNRLGLGITVLGTIAFRELTRAIGDLTGSLGSLAHEFLNINEQFARLQITLGSSLKSMSAAKQITSEILTLSASSPLSITDLGRVAQSVSILPQTSLRLLQQVNSGGINNPNGFLQNTVHTVEQMGTFRPDQPVESAIFALREALGGQLRSLIRRYDIGTNTLQQSSGLTTKQLTTQPDKMLKAISELFSNIISPEAVTASARQPSTLASQFYKQTVDIPLLSLGQEDKNFRSPYQAGLVRVQRVYDDLVKYMAEKFRDTLAPKISGALSKAVDSIFASVQGITSKILDHFGVSGTGAGVERVVTALSEALIKIIDFIGKLADSANSKSVIDSALNVVTSIFNGLKHIIEFFISLGKTTTPFISAATFALSPVILSNIGNITKFFAFDLPGAMNKLFSAVTRSKDQISAESFKGSSILSANSVSRGDRFNIPAFFNPLTASTSAGFGGSTFPTGDTYKRYAKALLSNPTFQGLMEEELATLPAGSSPALARSNFIRRQYNQDLRYISNPKNAGVISQLTDAGQGGSGLVGIGYASQVERDLARPRTSFLGQAGRAFGGAVAGAALGAGVAVLTTAAVVGVTSLIEALNANSKAIRDNTERRNALSEKTASTLGSEEFRTLSSFAGVDAKNLTQTTLESKDFTSLRDTVAAFNKLSENGNKAPEISGWDRFFTSVRQAALSFNTSQAGVLPVNTPEVAKLQSGIEASKGAEIIKRAGITDEVFSKALEVAVRSNGITDQVSKELAQKWVTDPLNAFKDFIAKVNAVPGGLNELKNRFDESFNDVTEQVRKKLYQRLDSEFGSYSDILKRISTGVINPKDANDLKAGLYRSAGIEDTLARSEIGNVISKDSFVSDLSATTDASYRKNFNTEYELQNFERLSQTRAAAQKEVADLLEVFNKQEKEVGQVTERMSKELKAHADQFGGTKRVDEFLATLKEIDPSKQFSVWRGLIKDRQQKLSEVGDLFVAGLGSLYEQLTSLISSFDKLPAQQFQERIKHINATLSETDPARALPRLPAIASPLTGNQGSDVQRAVSQAEVSAALRNFVDALNKAAATGFKATVPVNQTYSSPAIFQTNKLVSEASLPGTSTPEIFRSKASDYKTSTPEIFSFKASDYRTIAADNTLTNNIVPQIERLPGALTEEDRARQYAAQNAKVSAIQSSVTSGQTFNPAFDTANLTEAKKLLEELGYTADTTKQAMIGMYPLTQGKSATELLKQQIALQKKLIELLPPTEESAQRKIELQQQLNDLIVKQKQLEEQQKPGAFLDGLKEGLTTAKEDLNNFAEVGKQVGSTIKQSFGDAFADIVTGTQTASQAFRSMAVTILKAIANIFAQKAAESLINLAVGVFTGGSSSSGGGAALNSSSSLFASGGMVSGGSGYRDDVPIMAMGGEYVINKRAAQSIGYHNLEMLNQGKMHHFASGGVVPSYSSAPISTSMPAYGSSPSITHTTSIEVNFNAATGKSETTTESDVLAAQQLSSEIDALVEKKFQEKLRVGSIYNPINNRRR